MSDIRSFFGSSRAKANEESSAEAKEKASDLLPSKRKSSISEASNTPKKRVTSDDLPEPSSARKKRLHQQDTVVYNCSNSPAAPESSAPLPEAIAETRKSPRRDGTRKSSEESTPFRIPVKQCGSGSKKVLGADHESPGSSPTSPASSAKASLPLADLRFVVTGVMDSLSREDIEDLILRYGGKVTGSVSGRTSFLVSGVRLEDGRPAAESNKYKAALEKNIQILSEQDFLAKIPSQSSISTTTAISAQSISKKPAAERHVNVMDTTLWVDKYKPQNSSHLIGSAEVVRKLAEWLRNWEAVHVNHTKKIQFTKENPGAKAVLLSGPPGIGKSTVAGLAAKELQYDLIELNASDARNKKSVESILTNATTSCSIASCFGGASSSSTSLATRPMKRKLVIMDEVDGMGGSDRGGIAELIKVIKGSKIPIICICNDRQSQKIRSLVNHCYDIRVKRPTKAQIAQRLIVIAESEGLHMEPNAAEMLVEQSGNDIRQALNAMQMWHTQSSSMQYDDVRENMRRIEKDKVLRLTPFDACGQLLSGTRTPFQDRYESFFIDYSLTPLLVQQNYIDSSKNGIFRMPELDDAARMEQLSCASDAVSDSDLAGAKIMGQNPHWELLPTQAAFCLHAGHHVQGFQGFPSFPAWLGKHSTTSKMRRLTNELVHHTALSIGQGFMPVRLDYSFYLRQALLEILKKQPAQQGDNTNITELVEKLDWYGLSREDLMENMKEMQFIIDSNPSRQQVLKDEFGTVDSKVKTALTRAYNNSTHKSQVLVSELATKAGKKGRKASVGDDAPPTGPDGIINEDEILDDVAEDEASGSEEDISALIAKPKGKGKPNKTTTKSGSSKAKAKRK